MTFAVSQSVLPWTQVYVISSVPLVSVSIDLCSAVVLITIVAMNLAATTVVMTAMPETLERVGMTATRGMTVMLGTAATTAALGTIVTRGMTTGMIVHPTAANGPGLHPGVPTTTIGGPPGLLPGGMRKSEGLQGTMTAGVATMMTGETLTLIIMTVVGTTENATTVTTTELQGTPMGTMDGRAKDP